jgi:hypothetical protein
MKRLLGIVITFVLLTFGVKTQTTERPFILPLEGTPGPNTWLFGQPYGNTVGAYNFGTAWYSAGQGLHFGLDFPAPCGTPLVAVADGTVAFVDNMSRGAGPHNLLLEHPRHSVTTLYGHLREPSPLIPGQQVRQGNFVGYSGDPDSTCDSRPHLHFEVRSLDYFTAYNPVDYIDAPWHMLASIGGYSYPLFQGDMNNARRWMTLEDQPDTVFGGRRLNDYDVTWPLAYELRAPTNPPLMRDYAPIAEDATVELRQIGFDRCCRQHWWDATDPDRLYVIDGSPGQRAAVSAWSAQTGEMVEVVDSAPPVVTSPDGTYAIYNNGAQNVIRHRATGEEFTVQTQGVTPAISTGNSRLVWTIRSRVTVPGQSRADATVWVSSLDGSNVTEVLTAPGASAAWMDKRRLLIEIPGEGRSDTYTIYNTQDGSSFELGTWENLRGMSVSPGGAYVMFYLAFQEDFAANGAYVMTTQPGAEPQRLPWFGGWRWKDAESVYYLPFTPDISYHALRHYHIPSGDDRMLASWETGESFIIMNGDWDVSADGRHIVFQNALDWNMWLLEVVERK